MKKVAIQLSKIVTEGVAAAIVVPVVLRGCLAHCEGALFAESEVTKPLGSGFQDLPCRLPPDRRAARPQLCSDKRA